MSLTAASRRTRLATAAIALPLTLGIVLTGCSSGQITQTAEKRSGVPGAAAKIGELNITNAFIEPPTGMKYEAGDTVQLEMLVSSRGAGDEITKITLDGEAATISETGSSSTASATSTTPPSAEGSTSGSASASTSAEPSAEGSASGSASASTSAEPTTEAPAISTIEIPSQGEVYFAAKGGKATISVKLTKEAYPSALIPLTITFKNAGEVTFQVPVDTPQQEIGRDANQKYKPKEGGGH